MVWVKGERVFVFNSLNDIESAYTTTLNRFATLTASVDRVLLISASSTDATRLASSMQWRNYDHITMMPYHPGEPLPVLKPADLIIFCAGAVFGGTNPKQACTDILKTLQSLPKTPVILVADGYEDDFFVQCHDLGVREYLVYPVQEAMMTAKIIEQLAQKRLRHQLAMQQALLTQIGVIHPKTGVLNAVYWMEQTQKMVQRAIESCGRHPFSVIIAQFDISPTKNEPDQHLPLAREIAQTLQHALRNQDVVGQLSPTRFGILLADTQPSGAQFVVKRLKSALASLKTQSEGSGLGCFLTFQISSIQYRDEAHAQELMERAISQLVI
jgi:PleD family two-component response regulator